MLRFFFLSLFSHLSLAASPASVLKLIVRSPEPLYQAQTLSQAAPDEGDELKRLRRQEFRECQRQKRLPCPIHTRSITSAFLAGSAHHLFAATHAFFALPSRDFREASLKDFVKKFRRLDFELRDDTGKLLYDTETRPARVEWYSAPALAEAVAQTPRPPSSLDANLQARLQSAQLDALKICLGEHLNLEPFTIARDLPSPGDAVEARGIKGQKSQGNVLQPIESFLKLWPKLDRPFLEALWEKQNPSLLLHSAPIEPTWSGGPLLNAAGEVVALHHGFVYDAVPAHPAFSIAVPIVE